MKTEKVYCPNCGQICEGEIESILPPFFLDYYAHCTNCDYDITESEWIKKGD
jgi:C4-type Zn-finger protein